MEFSDAFSIFMAGLAIGLIGSHYLNQHEVKSAYHRGVLDTIWQIQLHGMREHLARVLGVAGHKEASSSDSSNTAV
jgi:hypothetical protein